MNPIKNKKDLETTIDDIRNYAFAYFKLMQSIDINNINCYKTLELNN